jgi:hypothetical protein
LSEQIERIKAIAVRDQAWGDLREKLKQLSTPRGAKYSRQWVRALE